MMTRFARILSATVACAVAPVLPVFAALGDVDGTAVEKREPAPGIMLAQYQDVEIFYDERGRRIILDAYTGEVIAIEEPRRAQIVRVPSYPNGVVRAPIPEERRYLDGYGLNDPDAVDRYDRYRDYQFELREAPTYDDDYSDRDYYDDERFPPRPSDDAGIGPSHRSVPSRQEDNRVVRVPTPDQRASRGEDVVRAPLQAPDSRSQLDGNPTGSVIEQRPQDVDRSGPTLAGRMPSEQVAKFQILLDRAGASPGVIDGKVGSNVNKALEAYQKITGVRLNTTDMDAIDAELERTGGPAFVTYTITPADAAQNFIASVPEDYSEKAQLERMSYTSVTEMLAERFHMDEGYLKALNPGADFTRPGTQVKVASPRREREGAVARIIADKANKQVRAYGADGKLISVYPATIGSQNTPSPTGTHTVERIAFEPEYTYNPKINFQQGQNDRILRIPPGPNGPVGNVWIALSKPTYGIHGTPEPSRIGKTYSNGCIRLTNWDATELAKMVSKGVTVEFVE